MKKKLAKIKYLPNNFQIIEPGDHVIYYSYIEAFKKKEKLESN